MLRYIIALVLVFPSLAFAQRPVEDLIDDPKFLRGSTAAIEKMGLRQAEAFAEVIASCPHQEAQRPIMKERCLHAFRYFHVVQPDGEFLNGSFAIWIRPRLGGETPSQKIEQSLLRMEIAWRDAVKARLAALDRKGR